MAKSKYQISGYVCIIFIALVFALYFAPTIIENPEFTTGFLSCLLVLTIGYLVLIIANYFLKKRRQRFSGKWVFLLVCMISFAVFAISLLGYLNESKNHYKIQQQENKIFQKSQLNTSSNNVVMQQIADYLHLIEKEQKNNTAIILTEHEVEKISQFSYQIKPYEKLENDSIIKWSPERGQLLLNLINLKLDSSSFREIRINSTFEFAQLEKCNLSNIDLSHVKLTGSILKECNLSYSILSFAKLNDSNYWGCNLNYADLTKAELKRVNFSWTTLKYSVLKHCNINGSTFQNVQLINAQLDSTKIKFSNFDGANLSNSQINATDLHGTSLIKANCSGCSLKNSNLIYTNWTDAYLNNADLRNSIFRKAKLLRTDLTKIKLDNVLVKRKDWFQQLKQSHTIGLENLTKNYDLNIDQTYESSYILKSKN